MTCLTFLVTGGAGFIGSALCRHLIANTPHRVVNLDKMTYAATTGSLDTVAADPRYCFVRGDIGDIDLVSHLLTSESVDIVVHLAAETHVDRSIDDPFAFVDTNVMGTSRLLHAAARHFDGLDADRRRRFRFLHVSTDEVFGDLAFDAPAFTEASLYRPSSPYAASKAASDHMARAWHRTYGLPVIVSNCSNNFGPFQFPEKLIPLVILNGLEGKPLPVFGKGRNVRDWLHVEDHARALELVATKGQPGVSYNIGAQAERNNLDVVERICDALDRLAPLADATPHRSLITFVSDRPGHDLRYAIDPAKLSAELGWAPRESFEDALERTVRWYIDNEAWWRPIRDGRYRGERLGTGGAERR